MSGQVHGDRFAVLPEELLEAEISDRAVRLWAFLHRYAGQDGRAFPGRRILSGKLRCSNSTLDQALRELQQAGWLRIEPRHREDGSRTTNDYHLVRPDPRPVHEEAPSDPPVGVAASTGQQEGEPDNENQIREPSPAPDGAVSKRARERAPNPGWDALVAAVGWEPKTGAEKGRVGKALREIEKALPEGTSREDVGRHIEARARRYREHWPNAELTPEALVKHWSKFGPNNPVRPAASPAPAPERGTMTRAEMLRRKDAAERTWDEFLVSLEGLSETEREIERRSRRDGLRERIFVETGVTPTRETGWFYEEGERGWYRRGETPGQPPETAATGGDAP